MPRTRGTTQRTQRNVKDENCALVGDDSSTAVGAAPRRRRGRPLKRPLTPPVESSSESENESSSESLSEDKIAAPRRRAGRPRKRPPTPPIESSSESSSESLRRRGMPQKRPSTLPIESSSESLNESSSESESSGVSIKDENTNVEIEAGYVNTDEHDVM